MTEQSSPRDADGAFPWRRWLGRHGRRRADVVNALVGPPGARRSVLARCQRATEAERTLLLNDLLLQALNDHTDWVAAYRALQVNDTAVALASIRLEAVRGSWRGGDRPAIDTLEAYIQFQDRQMRQQQAALNFRNAALRLSNHLWDDAERPLEGNGGSAGAAGAPPGGAAGSSGTSGGAGAAGNAGAPSCTAKTPDKPPMTLKCGNGVIDAGETCDDGAIGAMIDGDGCSVNCAVKCDPPSVSIQNHCYSLVDVNALANEIYDGPTMPDQTNDLVRPRWADDPCAGQGVATHLAIFETTAAQNDLQAAAGFEALSAKFAFAGVWIGAGARYRSDQTVDKVAAWRNGEGGLFLGKWKTGNPGVTGGRCVVTT